MFRTIGLSHADVAPVMSGILRAQAVAVHNPLTIRRPLSSKVKMPLLCCEFDAVSPVRIARPDLISLRAGKMKGNSHSIGTQA